MRWFPGRLFSGIGSCVTRSGWSLLSAIFSHLKVSGSGRWGSEQWACFHTITWQWTSFTRGDKASLVGGSVSGFPFFENKIARASSTDPMLSNLYILKTNSWTSFIFSSVSSPSSSKERSVWCFRNTFQADFFESLHMKDVVSQPVKVWKGRRADTEPAGRFSYIALMLKHFRFVSVSDIMYRLGQGMRGTCATRSNKKQQDIRIPYRYTYVVKAAVDTMNYRTCICSLVGCPQSRQVDCSFWWLHFPFTYKSSSSYKNVFWGCFHNDVFR